MNERPKAGGPRWLSFHVFLPGAFETFLVDYLLPAVTAGLAAGRLKRFFFIRYSEGGYHLRLRFLPGPAAGAEDIKAELGGLLGKFITGTGCEAARCRMEEHRYDRAELYFGETLLSIYAELLNEQTSYLGLRLLRARYPTREHLMLVLGAALHHLLHRSVGSPHDFAAALRQSAGFAAETAAEHGFLAQPPDAARQAKRRDLLLKLLPRTAAALQAEPDARRIVRLLRRARRCQPDGEFVALHALHLLCNKLGVSIVEEYNLFDTLHRLVTDTPSSQQPGA